MLPVQLFVNFVRQNALFDPADKILLAVSGGKDSVLMAHLFSKAGFCFDLAHCNFNLRGNEAKRDKDFVISLSEQLGVKCHVIQFDTQQHANNQQISIQMAARELRYQWFEKLLAEQGYDYVAIAQHQNDAMETLLLNLCRGTGISGMHGIRVKRDRIIRPLMFLSRLDIDKLVEKEQIAFVEDSSNCSDKYARNNIRHHVVPALRMINPSLEYTFSKNIERFSEIEKLLSNIVSEKRDQIFHKIDDHFYLKMDRVKELFPQKLLLFELLRPFAFTEDVVSEILQSLDKQSGTFFVSKTHQIAIDRNQLVLSPRRNKTTKELAIYDEGSYRLEDNQILSFCFSDDLRFLKDRDKVYIDASLLVFPLIIRHKVDGDKFVPLGMRGYKKLSNFFVDEKVPLALKTKVPILCNGNGDIIWVLGMRQDERYKLTDKSKKVAIFEILNQ